MESKKESQALGSVAGGGEASLGKDVSKVGWHSYSELENYWWRGGGS